MSDPKNRRPTDWEEEAYNDAIEQELDDWDDQYVRAQLGHVPGGGYYGYYWEDSDWPVTPAEPPKQISTEDGPEAWKEFLKELERDLDGGD